MTHFRDTLEARRAYMRAEGYRYFDIACAWRKRCGSWINQGEVELEVAGNLVEAAQTTAQLSAHVVALEREAGAR